MVEGNSISAGFTALWRGLSGDEESAKIAANLLTEKQIQVMEKARFAPTLRSLVGARASAVESSLWQITDQPGPNVGKENVDDQLLSAYLKGPPRSLVDAPNDSEWLSRWKDFENLRNSKTTEIETEKLPLKSGSRWHSTVIVSLGSGFDTRCISVRNKGNSEDFLWIRVDRECVQKLATEHCIERNCQNCFFLNGDVLARSTWTEIKRTLIKQQSLSPEKKKQTLIWLAEGLMEYLNESQQNKMLEHITNVQRELESYYEGELLLALLSKAIDNPIRTHYGASFGWKWTDPAALQASLKNAGWVIPEGMPIKKSKETWGHAFRMTWKGTVTASQKGEDG